MKGLLPLDAGRRRAAHRLRDAHHLAQGPGPLDGPRRPGRRRGAVGGRAGQADRFRGRRHDAHPVRKDGEPSAPCEARYVIGADGAYSTVRKAMFPDAEFGTSAAYREWYPGSPSLDDDWAYVVFPRGVYRPNVWICPKDDGFTFEGAGVKPLHDEIRALLRADGWTRARTRVAGRLRQPGAAVRAPGQRAVSSRPSATRCWSATPPGCSSPSAARASGPRSRAGCWPPTRSRRWRRGRRRGDADAAAAYLGALAPLQATLADMYAEVAQVRTLTGEALLDGVARGLRPLARGRLGGAR